MATTGAKYAHLGQPDDRTTAEWIGDLVRARQEAEAQLEKARRNLEIVGSAQLLMHMAIDRPLDRRSLVDQVRALVKIRNNISKYAADREVYSRRGAVVHSARIASDLKQILERADG